MERISGTSLLTVTMQNYCKRRRGAAPYSETIRSLISTQSGHPFQRKAATHSKGSRQGLRGKKPEHESNVRSRGRR